MKLTLVTGGSRGLGDALCREYRERGWRVVEFSRSGGGGGVQGSGYGSADGGLQGSVHVDLADPVAAHTAFDETLTTLGPGEYEEIVAIGNAGTLLPIGPIERATPEEIVANLQLNLVSQVLFARAVVAAFQEHRCPKTFVAVSSGAAVKGYAGWSLYCAAKAAMDGFVRALALEQARHEHPVVAVSVNPGVMDTTMQEAIRAASDEAFPARGRFAGLHEAGALRAPAEVATAIAETIERRPAPGSHIAIQVP